MVGSQGFDFLAMSGQKLSQPFLVLLCLEVISLLVSELLLRQFLNQLINFFGVQFLLKLH